tara:strand:+ start:882 stop:1121 length:240 start_codon:yes stop_codon:yes gene_type:complete
MNLFKKIFVPSGEKTELTAYESWQVKWVSRCGVWADDTEKEAEVFTNKEEADKFAQELKAAFKLLKYTGNVTHISVTKN